MALLVGLIICGCIAFMVIAAIASATRPDCDGAAPRRGRAGVRGGASDGSPGANWWAAGDPGDSGGHHHSSCGGGGGGHH